MAAKGDRALHPPCLLELVRWGGVGRKGMEGGGMGQAGCRRGDEEEMVDARSYPLLLQSPCKRRDRPASSLLA